MIRVHKGTENDLKAMRSEFKQKVMRSKFKQKKNELKHKDDFQYIKFELNKKDTWAFSTIGTHNDGASLLHIISELN